MAFNNPALLTAAMHTQMNAVFNNFYAGIKGDNNNVMLAAAAMNFKRMMNICKKMFFDFFIRIIIIIQNFLQLKNIFNLIPK